MSQKTHKIICDSTVDLFKSFCFCATHQNTIVNLKKFRY